MMAIDGMFGDNISWGNHVTEVMNADHVVYYDSDGSSMFDDTKEYIATDTEPSKWRALDCGCHVGRWTDVLKNYGFAYTGVDQCDEALQVCKQNRPGVEYIHTPLWDMGIKEEFDLVFTVAVLQHNLHAEQERIVPRMYDALKPGGVMFITESTNKENHATGRTQQGWVDLCKRHGFRLVKFWHKNSIGLEDHYLFIKEKQ
jgi:2-polyprenyl-3-methyl-5-hydroxy-6-metoxy-1,4-benzoquinol methylase